jgi:hypothetical protein
MPIDPEKNPMITFKSTKDLNKLSPNDPAQPVIKKLIDQLIRAYTWEGHPYVAEDYGYIILIEPEDTDRVLDEIWDDWTLLDIPWEGIMLRDGFFIAIFLANNEYGLVFVIPDADWVNGKLRKMIEDTLDP